MRLSGRYKKRWGENLRFRVLFIRVLGIGVRSREIAYFGVSYYGKLN